MLWDEDTQKMMMTLWNDEGLSASDIASRLSKHFGKEMTRNSVVAKAWRLRANGVHMRGRGVLTAVPKKKKARGKLPRTLRKPVLKPPARTPLEMAMRIVPFKPKHDDTKPTVMSVGELEAHHCRWPVGDVGKEGFGFCGQDRFSPLPYCAHHARIGFQPPQPQSRMPNTAQKVGTNVLEDA